MEGVVTRALWREERDFVLAGGLAVPEGVIERLDEVSPNSEVLLSVSISILTKGEECRLPEFSLTLTLLRVDSLLNPLPRFLSKLSPSRGVAMNSSAGDEGEKARFVESRKEGVVCSYEDGYEGGILGEV